MSIMTGQSTTNVRQISIAPDASPSSTTEQSPAVGFEVTTDKDTYRTLTVLVASGSHRRKLDIPGADQFENKGVVYCASCDGPLFSDQDVVVIGGGNAGFETAAQLLAYCKSVTLLDRGDRFKADELTVESVLKNSHMKAVTNAIPTEIVGEKFVTGIKYKIIPKISSHDSGIESDLKSNSEPTLSEEILLPTTGIFIEIGQRPNVDYLKDINTTQSSASTPLLNSYNHIIVDPRTQRTTLTGIWAAGDVTDGLYHQNNIAVGDAVKALEDIYLYVKAGK
jgi:alkyl hydroperoxide reductase subunit F